MPNCDSHQNGGSESINDVQRLAIFLSSLYRRDLIAKPAIFYGEMSASSHIKAVEKYVEKVNLKEDQDKVAVLLETLDNKVRNVLFFENEYCLLYTSPSPRDS